MAIPDGKEPAAAGFVDLSIGRGGGPHPFGRGQLAHIAAYTATLRAKHKTREGARIRMQSRSSKLERSISLEAQAPAAAPGRRLHYWLKDILDLIIGVVALVVFSPVLLIVALAVKLDSPGPAIFKQKRIGKDGNEFTVWKFRSMYVNADDRPHREAMKKLVEGEPAARVNGQGFFKPVDDPRVTRLGKFLRATGLDELPQVFNILRREMSVVGPRPAIPYELELYKEWHHRRLAVRPGVTGLWQVRRHDTQNFDDVIRLDLEYIDSFSIWLDLKIILLTFPMILFRRWTF
jgi:lipopolysaccharide/colanic/teichoic acid biosynthesis glycosyltransferase